MLLLDICVDGPMVYSPEDKRSRRPSDESVFEHCHVRLRDSFRPKSTILNIECSLGNVVVRPVKRGRKVRVSISGDVEMPKDARIRIKHVSSRKASDQQDKVIITSAGRSKNANIETIIEIPESLSHINVDAMGTVLVSETHPLDELYVKTYEGISCFASASSYRLDAVAHGDVLLAPVLACDATAKVDVLWGSVMTSPRNTSSVDSSRFHCDPCRKPDDSAFVPAHDGHVLEIRGAAPWGTLTVC